MRIMAELKLLLNVDMVSLAGVETSGVNFVPQFSSQFLKGRFSPFYLPFQLPEAIYYLGP